jgi:hypothetical protein
MAEGSDVNSPSRFRKMTFIKEKYTSGQESKTQELKAQDIFDIGFILLVCATGGLELLEEELLK